MDLIENNFSKQHTESQYFSLNNASEKDCDLERTVMKGQVRLASLLFFFQLTDSGEINFIT